MNAPRLWSIVLALCVLVLTVEDSSRQVSAHPCVLCVVQPLALVVLANYLWCMLPRHAAMTSSRRRSWWRWMVAPCAAVVGVSARLHPWALQLRFELSRPAFEKALAEVHSGKPWSGPRWVGLFPVSHVCRSPGEESTCFVVGESIADPVAICHDPRQPPEHWLNRRISGFWYAKEL